MICDNVRGIRYLFKQDLALAFCRKKTKNVDALTEIHINYDLIRHIKNNWMGPIFFFSGNSHTKELIVLPHLGLEGITEVETN